MIRDNTKGPQPQTVISLKVLKGRRTTSCALIPLVDLFVYKFNMENPAPELLDEILGHLPSYAGAISLRNRSLVAKSSTYPARRRPFEYPDIRGEARLRS